MFNFYCGSINVAWIPLRNGHKHIFTFHQLSKHSVAIIEMGGRSMRDKELRTVGPGPGIRHGENAALVVSQAGMEFIRKFITRTAAAGACGIAALYHEVTNDAVE